MALLLLLVALSTAVSSSPSNLYAGANTLYTSHAWATMMSSATAPIAAHSQLASLAAAIASYADVTWLTTQEQATAMSSILADAATKPPPTIVTFVAYFIPNRDCNGQRAGGAASLSDYQTFINTILSSVRAYPSIRVSIILEPGAFTHFARSACTAAASYPAALQAAISTLAGSPNIALYLDIGNIGDSTTFFPVESAIYGAAVAAARDSVFQRRTGFWVTLPGYLLVAYTFATANTISTLLKGASSTATMRGFSTNVGNYYPVVEEIFFMQSLNIHLSPHGYGEMRFITDTSRNGVTVPRLRGEWCNILGASLGTRPQPSPSATALLDAFLWVTSPGQSDGPSPATWSISVNNSCIGPNSAPNAPPWGDRFDIYFAMLLQNAVANSAGPMTGSPLPDDIYSGNPYQHATMYSSGAWAAMVTAAAGPGTEIANTPALFSLAQNITGYGDATWITSQDEIDTMRSVLEAALSFPSPINPTTVTIVINHIPNMGCTAGAGASSLTAYQAFLDSVANMALTFPAVRVVVIVEPGIVAAMGMDECNGNTAIYASSLQSAVTKLSRAHNVAIYIDIGSSSSVSRTAIVKVALIISSIVGSKRSVLGLSTNVGGYNPLPAEYAFITAMSSALASFGSLARLRFLTDTSRNGLDTSADIGEWCNIDGAALGMAPTVSPEGFPLIDATLYVKSPGVSDGYSAASASTNMARTCTGPNSVLGAPNQGKWFQPYFVMLLTNTISGIALVRQTTPVPSTTDAPHTSSVQSNVSLSSHSSSVSLVMIMLVVGAAAIISIMISIGIWWVGKKFSISRKGKGQQSSYGGPSVSIRAMMRKVRAHITLPPTPRDMGTPPATSHSPFSKKISRINTPLSPETIRTTRDSL